MITKSVECDGCCKDFGKEFPDEYVYHEFMMFEGGSLAFCPECKEEKRQRRLISKGGVK